MPSCSALIWFGPGVEPDDLHLVALAGLLHTGGGALGGEQVRGEDADEVGVLLQRGADQLCCGRRVVVGVLHADVGELAVGLDGVLEALDARVGRRDAGVDGHHQDLAALGVQLLDRVEGRRAAALVVAGDLRTPRTTGRSVVVSTSTTLIPAAAACCSGRCMAATSVGAISSASGLARDDRVDDRLLQGRVELLRALRVDRDAELRGLGLRCRTAW